MGNQLNNNMIRTTFAAGLLTVAALAMTSPKHYDVYQNTAIVDPQTT